LWEENVLAYEAFQDLTLERYNGLGEGPIPPSAVRAYARDMALDVEDLMFKIRVLDAAWLKHSKERREREQERKARERDRSERLKGGRR
jgi:hypothetical protein